MYCQHCRQINALKTISNKYLSVRSSNFSTASATSVSPQEISDDIEATLTYCKDDVTLHSSNDYLKFYTLPKESTQTRLVDVIPQKFKELSKTVQESTILLRKPSLQVITQLKEMKDGDEAQKFILYGATGSGKTLSLLHIIHYYLQTDGLVLHLPNASRFMDSQKKTTPQESQWNTSRVDQPQEAMDWLKIFKNMNIKHLTEMKTSQKYSWGKRESTEKDKPLLDVLEQGIGRSLFSTDAVGVLLKEIQSQKNVKVLYAVDAFNAFFGHTSHKLFGKQVGVENLALRRHFLKLLKPENSLQNGVYIMCLSQSIQHLERKANPSILDDILPSNLLSSLGDFHDIEVTNFTEDEFLHLLTYYKHRGWLARELNEDLVRELQFLTNRNPTLIRKYCASL